MGQPKAWLEFHGETLLRRVARALSEVVTPVVVVAAAGQDLPPLDPHVLLVRDARPERGPLEGMLAGFQALSGQADAVFVASCDAPLISAPFVRRVIDSLADHEIAAAETDGFAHPLAAAYRLDLLPTIEAMLAADRLRPTELLNECRTRRLTREDFTDIDPELYSLRTCNTPAEYEALLQLSEAS
jgi:molybdopterin-guanine dinucleotide biosynthesis protein A